MPEANARVTPREKFEVSLDGRQAASIVVGALVVLAVVFGLGLTVGRQISQRKAERSPAGDLEALDRAPAPAKPLKDESLTFHDRLTKETPPEPPPAVAAAPAARPEPAPAKPPAAPPAAVQAAVAAAPAPAAPSPAPPRAAAPSPAPSSAPPRPAPSASAAKPWTVQLAAAQERAEAERIRTRFAALHPRIEEADVPGRGRFYRVRVGGFESKGAAERYLRDVGRETGAKGFVTAAR